MTERSIPIADLRYPSVKPVVPSQLLTPTGALRDARGRSLHDLRISVTDRCNFRCTYCMPKSIFDSEYAFLPQSSLLRFEEIHRLACLFVAHGTEKIRLTGGEPLLRKHLEHLVGMLASLRTPGGKPVELTLTTNGTLLVRKAQALAAAGLRRVTVSLDALDDATFQRMNDVGHRVTEVLEGIEAAAAAGLGPIKINMVVRRGVNDHSAVAMARHFRNRGQILRFIEYMDVGASNGWRMDEVVPSAELRARIHNEFPLEPIDPNYTGEVAERWRYRDGGGEIGFIASVTQPFCGDCTRARLSTEGRLYTCLFAHTGYDLRALLRDGHSDDEIASAIGLLWQARQDRYSEVRAERTPYAPEGPSAGAQDTGSRRIEMSYIGG